ncbi:hypothetical protein AUP07_0107 [methanogenic archaeon mixed culture ISO4-G1]|nr:hypothetical protein AUP07_0107 [methanogenic archaeon mixed culture ISO4-G1]
MSAMPSTMKLGMAIAFLGAIVAFASMAFAWDGTVECAPLVGINMASAMMFFAVAGCFSTYSPVKASTIVALSAVAIAMALLAGIFSAMMPVICVFLVILGVVCLMCGNLPSTKDFVETNRVI